MDIQRKFDVDCPFAAGERSCKLYRILVPC